MDQFHPWEKVSRRVAYELALSDRNGLPHVVVEYPERQFCESDLVLDFQPIHHYAIVANPGYPLAKPMYWFWKRTKEIFYEDATPIVRLLHWYGIMRTPPSELVSWRSLFWWARPEKILSDRELDQQFHAAESAFDWPNTEI